MSKERFNKLLLEPENKSWVRAIDGIMVLFVTLAAGVIFFVLPLKMESVLLNISFWGVLLSTPIVAYTMYRHTNLTKIERIAILVLALSTAFSLLVASVESTTNI